MWERGRLKEGDCSHSGDDIALNLFFVMFLFPLVRLIAGFLLKQSTLSHSRSTHTTQAPHRWPSHGMNPDT